MDILKYKINNIKNQKDLAYFIKELAEKYDPSWENNDLPSFVEAMTAWVSSMDNYYRNNNLSYDENNISWKNIADMLYVATIYE